MARTPRRDRPNQFHHVMNRGARRQVLFADRRDCRCFLALLACAVRRGELEVVAFALIGTHFHLLVRSPTGRISYAMMRVQNAFARYRNRRAREDGPLFRGRFRSKPVTSTRYLLTLVRYIDQNAVRAGLCRHPFEYPFASARYYATETAPRWVDRRPVYACVRSVCGVEAVPEEYARVFGAPLGLGEIELIERRLARPHALEDDLDALFAAPPRQLAAWIKRKTRASGGRSPWSPVASSHGVTQAVRRAREDLGEWLVSPGRKRARGWEIAAAGLLSTLACYGVEDIAVVEGCHPSTAARRVRQHRALMQSDPTYQSRIGMLARQSLDLTLPPTR